MNAQPLHEHTRARIDDFVRRPSHALLLSGAKGSGKGTLARSITAALQHTDEARLANSQYTHFIVPDANTISVATVRDLEHFFSLRAGKDAWRVAVIEDSHTMTNEAQNALLKTLEEPPANTTIILTATNEQALLPTVRSRVIHIPVHRPAPSTLHEYFTTQGFPDAAVAKALLMSGGLPGLTQALLAEDTTHPLIEATTLARDIIQKTPFERLALVDMLSRQKELAVDVLGMLTQMAHVALEKQPNARWQRILTRSYEAIDLLQASAQPKLVLTDLMLGL